MCPPTRASSWLLVTMGWDGAIESLEARAVLVDCPMKHELAGRADRTQPGQMVSIGTMQRDADRYLKTGKTREHQSLKSNQSLRMI